MAEKNCYDSRDVFEKALDDPDEYDRRKKELERQYRVAKKRRYDNALWNTPEGKKRRQDAGEGALLGAALWTAQRLARRGFRGGRPKPLTGIGGLTLPFSMLAAGTANARIEVEKRRKHRK